jgi:hypothetical protein
VAGHLDVAAITEAFKIITSSAVNLRPAGAGGDLSIHLGLDEDNGRAVIEWRGLKINDGDDPFHSFIGSEGLRMSLAAKIIEAHGGETNYDAGKLRAQLPLEQQG